MCRGLLQTDPLRLLVHRLIFFAVALVLTFNGLGFLFLWLQPHFACIFVALGSFIAHGFISCFSVAFLIQQSPMETVSQKLFDTVLVKRTWGTLCCASVAFTAAAASLGLLALAQVDQFLSVIAYSTRQSSNLNESGRTYRCLRVWHPLDRSSSVQFDESLFIEAHRIGQWDDWVVGIST